MKGFPWRIILGMSEDSEKPGGPRRNPVNANAPRPARPKRQPPAAMSKESRFIGYIVLGFGIVAILAVLLIAFGFGSGNKNVSKQKISEKKQVAQLTQEEQAYKNIPPRIRKYVEPPESIAKDLTSVLAQTPKAAAVVPQKQVLFFKRQPGLDAAKIVGAWKSTIGKYTAVLNMDGKVYQVVLADPDNYGYRLYSSGTYQVIDDMILFKPQKKWPSPTVPAGQEIEYKKITAARFPVIAAIGGEKMFWQHPPRTEERVTVPRAMPILMGQKQDVVTWLQVK